ncbi:Serine/threonine protein kinase [Trema orientale]|uniref:non-specific serine/threonine protein kinase n=1 Tax=Trema orientale TaxID=63057 RepID=A0A2P5EP05_TREOI|nr:Serine/threonine protein kinase [Trema orientale]
MAASSTNISTDQSSLLAFKSHITNDPENILTNNWLASSTNSVCNWVGVTCGQSHFRVTSLNLSFMGLVGTIPPHLGNLSFLVNLSFTNNSFHGTLPVELSRLRRLKSLNFGFNSLTGEIPPWLGSLPKLQSLFLFGNQLSGPIPTQIFNSSSLEKLVLSFNQLSEIPEEIGNLQLLEELSIQNAGLKGSIPLSLFNMSSLKIMGLTGNKLVGSLPDDICQNLPVVQELYFSKNQLSGLIPSKLWQCTELLYLSMSFNSFTRSIPRSIGNLTQAMEIHLANNSLTGTIPDELADLHNLEVLALFSNKLIGSIPSTLFNVSSLRTLSLADNQLSGALSSSIGLGVPNLQELEVDLNYISGEIPKSISNASRLAILDMAVNSFSGFIPNSLSTLRDLWWLNLGGNHLTIESTTSEVSSLLLSLFSLKDLKTISLANNPLNVTLPLYIGNRSTSLQKVDLSNCKLMGNIPSDIGNLSSLILLSLAHNGLSGTIPTSVGRLQKLQRLDLSDNMFQGSIPFEICQLESLADLVLTNNKLSASVPLCIGNLTIALRSLLLGSNKLTSKIPSSLWSLAYILDIDLSHNSLIGSLVEDFSNLKVVTHVDLSDNQLSGNIPGSIGDLQNLVNLSLAKNNLEGPIPDSFGNLLSMEWLDLSKNRLSGEIPRSLEALLHLKYLNVSFNKLHGEIPTKGPFANFSSQSFISNEALCGAPRLGVLLCKKAPQKANAIVLKYLLPSILAILLLMAVLVVLILRRKRNVRLPKSENTFSLQEIWRRVSYHDLFNATNGFSEENLLGAGSFGSVYKGTLSDAKIVAVKVFNLQVEDGFRSFDRECELLRNLRHRNLVKIITSCSGTDFRALVLEYMPRGSLEKWLYSDEVCLNIIERLNIMIDVALALEYLHYGYSTAIVHCDLKPSNVLLDDDMVAHVADFGIARFLGGSDSMTRTMTLATIGYMAPEFGLEGIVSRNGDVYSYGIMLIETFTRKKPTDEMFNEEMSLKQWVENSIPHGITDIIDANLLRRGDEHYPIKKDCLSSVIGLALSCSATSPEDRIDMKNVAATLNKIKTKFLKEVGEN